MYLQVCTELEYIDSYTVHNVCEERGGEGGGEGGGGCGLSLASVQVVSTPDLTHRQKNLMTQA